MALPATNIQLSAVNTELGNTSTASIDLNTPRVRSLGGVSTTSTTFSMSSFANQSATWFFGVDVVAGYTGNNFGVSVATTPKTDQSAHYILSDSEFYLSPQYGQIRKVFVNKNLDQTFQYLINGSSTGIIYNFGVGPSNTSNLYFCVDSSIAKISSSGTALAAVELTGVPGAFQYCPTFNVDSSENIYLTGYEIISGSYQSVLISFDSSLGFRWAKYLPDQPLAGQNWQHNQMGFDSSGNYYLNYATYSSSSPTSSEMGYLKFNSSGTLLQQLHGYISGGSSIPYYAGAAVNGSGATVHGFIKDFGNYSAELPGIIFVNSSGAVQWAKCVGAPSVTYNGYYTQALTIDDSGNVYLIAAYEDVSAGNRFLSITKFNSSGTVLWQRKLLGGYQLPPPSGFNYFTALNAGSAYLTGSNQELLSFVVFAGYLGFYSTSVNPILFTIRTDGSGTGTYTAGNTTFYYTSSSTTASSETFISYAGPSLVSRSYSTTAQTLTSTTPATVGTFATNI